MKARSRKAIAFALAGILYGCGGPHAVPQAQGSAEAPETPAPAPVDGLRFKPPTDTGPVGTHTALAAGDLNGDGFGDVVVLAHGGVQVFLGNRTGRLQAAALIAPDLGTKGSIAIADFDNDGRPDIAVGTAHGTLAVLAGRGDGTFGAPKELALGPPDPRVSYTVRGLVTGDLDHDGRMDIVALVSADLEHSSSLNTDVLLGQGDGTFTPARGGDYLDADNGAVIADLDGDGNLDLVMDTENWIYYGRGDGSFTGPTARLGDVMASFLVPGDFNGDGRTDLVIVNRTDHGGDGAVYLGTKGRGFGAAITLPDSFHAGAVAAADFDGDGRLDLVGSGGGAPIASVRRGNGDGTFHAGVYVGTLANASPFDAGPLAITDVNGDGRPDLAVIVGQELWTLLNDAP
jgi:hypothetical protein